MNHVSIKSPLENEPNEKLNLNISTKLNSTVLLLVTFGLVLITKLHSKHSINSKISPGTSDKNFILANKVVLFKYD